MNINNYKKRIVDDKLEKYLNIFGAVLVEGPKWCGKTWTSRNIAKSEILIANPSGNFNNRTLAQLYPDLALNGDNPRLIDEWQEVPQLWDAVRGKIDETGKKGMFILTGSSSINKNKYIHSGTGRIARIKMRPMSLYESGHSTGKVSLEKICNGVEDNILARECDLNYLIDCILRGGWPSTIDNSLEDSMVVAREYVNSIINEDIYKVDNIKRDKHKIELLLRSLARNETTTVTNLTLKKDIKEKDFDDISLDTIADYLALFNAIHITENIKPYASKIRSSIRVKQSEKRHFVDPSLPAAILSLSKEKLLNDLELLGFLFESLVHRDLLTYVEAMNAKLYHYQDYKNNEMDAVIELEDGNWVGVEVKLGAHKIEEAANNLLKVNERIVKEGGIKAKALIVVCGLTNACYIRPDGVYVTSITDLKN